MGSWCHKQRELHSFGYSEFLCFSVTVINYRKFRNNNNLYFHIIILAEFVLLIFLIWQCICRLGWFVISFFLFLLRLHCIHKREKKRITIMMILEKIWPNKYLSFLVPSLHHLPLFLISSLALSLHLLFNL